ncbi:transcription factor TFIIIC subunit TFC3 NDAI_0J01800 [Naumovozyma dairenensis CBS 421]|uniref:Uncharacterized protein n=1 Tax=Naumovozyma dairenensis (strain ATCC 10597 / BCRC 20456 / CBS 421 / NBRC 0211 / NRRL Y-12639) TaxID=1071378 RepID=G0WGZ4_NAUDC|nr:hypothetical protein NDAI_0J01800 [Naumovozyma dairenensis CBS 421]CCD27072.1 hypothetical protein NDAI_0J01800 [Naumovozyma dairenensis CBS 421]
MSTIVGNIYPDELIGLLCEELAYNKGSVPFSKLWELVANIMNLSNKKIKQFVFQCLVSCEDIRLCHDSSEEVRDYNTVVSNPSAYHIVLDEDRLWKILTGYIKKESTIGNFAFALLLEIAKSKENGVNTIDLAQATNQDSRSITGRLKKLAHLVVGTQIVYKGHVVKLLKLKKFVKGSERSYVNMRDHLATIVKIVKESKNGLRQVTDLKRELGFDKAKRQSKAFTAAISWLDEKQYLKKVLVVSPNNTAIKIKCVKYQRDYDGMRNSNAFDDDNESSDEDPGDKSGLDDEDDEDIVEGLEHLSTGTLLQEPGLILEENLSADKDFPLLNRFYPIQNQTYDLAEKSDLSGASTIEVVNKITGKEYKRAFTKYSEYYLDSAGKTSQDSSGFNIIRVYDFDGKKKFFRLFTETNYKRLTGSSSGMSGFKKRDEIAQKDDLSTLNRKNFVALSNTLHFTTDHSGIHTFFWNGEIKGLKKNNGLPKEKKRRQSLVERDSNIDVSEKNLVKRKKMAERNNTMYPTLIHMDAIDPTISREQSQEEQVKPEIITIGGFSAASLRSLKRQKAIIEVLKRQGGVTYLKEQFFENLSKYMESNTQVDKKTARRDVDLMVASGKLLDRVDPVTKRRIVFLPEVDDATITNYVVNEKDHKKEHFTDIIHNTDIYFFDQTEKNRFHRGAKSAERIRKFQKGTKNKKETVDRTKKADVVASNRSISKPRKDPTKERSKKAAFKASKKQSRELETFFHLGTKAGLQALIMCVVITKSITNEIKWDLITRLFPHNSLDNLKKQWTIRRVRMGSIGWKVHVEKWKKVLVKGIKDGLITLEEAEQLDLPKLITLWNSFKEDRGKTSISLYKAYEDNKRNISLVREDDDKMSPAGLMMSSMVQREMASLNNTYAFDTDKPSIKELIANDTRGKIRAVIRSILVENVSITKERIEALENVTNDEVDRVVMDMAKEKQLYLHGSKLEATSIAEEFSNSKGRTSNFEQSATYYKRILAVFEGSNGLVMNTETADTSTWSLIDLISRKSVNMDIIPMQKDSHRLNYVTRRFEIGSLTPPLIIYPKNRLESYKNGKNISIPAGKPFSRLWIDSTGEIRTNLWKKQLSSVLFEILFSPGITLTSLQKTCSGSVSLLEASEICDWLFQKELLAKTSYGGFKVTSNWYSLFL